MEVEWKDGVWLPYETVSPGLVPTRRELLDKVRSEGATIADDAQIAVFLGEDAAAYAIKTSDGWMFNGITDEDHDVLVEAVNRVFTEADDERNQD